MMKKISLSFAVLAASAAIMNTSSVSATENEPVGFSVKGSFLMPTDDSGKNVDKDGKKEFTWNLGGGIDFKIGEFNMDSDVKVAYGVEAGANMGDNWNAFGGGTLNLRFDRFYAQGMVGYQYGKAKKAANETKDPEAVKGLVVKPTIGFDIYELGETPVFAEVTYVYNVAEKTEPLGTWGFSVGVRF